MASIDPKVRDRKAEWAEQVTKRLPKLLSELLACDVYGLGDGCELPPANVRYGVYLFSEKRQPRYVGRVGLTERSKLAGKSYSSFRTRLRSHSRPRHNEGTYAYSRAVRAFRRKHLPLAETRKANCENPAFMKEFRRQCERVRAMGFQVVEITDDRLAAVFEVYAATVLGLRDQSFAVS